MGLASGAALIVLQARMGSTRLPGKVLADIAGVSILERCIRRLQAADLGPVVVATTSLAIDDTLVELGTRLGALILRGSVEDVLERYVRAADSWKTPFVVRATADNPLVDLNACHRVLECLSRGADYVSERGLPVGAAVEGMRRNALLAAGREATEAYDREHVTPWLRRAQGLLEVRELAAPETLSRPDLSFTVDTPGDLDHVRRIVRGAGGDVLVPLLEYIRVADRLAGSGPSRMAEAGSPPDTRPESEGA
jgi:spore coat polysaccharide biosynthesis protein SpsF (cytidylyltransferase family)